MKTFIHLFSTGNLYQDLLLYSLVGLLAFANIWLIRQKAIRRELKKA